jgi:hypothetical protein
MIKRIIVGGISALGFACAPVHAQEAAYYYAGLGVGQAMIQDSGPDGFDDESTAFNVFWGFAVSKYLGMEFGYLDTGTAEDRIDGIPVESQLSGVLVSLRGVLPFTDSLGAFVKIGGALYDVDTTARIGGSSVKVEPNDIEASLAYAAGAEAIFGGKFGLRLEYQVIQNSDADVEIVSISGLLKF